MADFFNSIPRENATVRRRTADRSEPSTTLDAVRRRHNAELLAIDGVAGVATTDDGLLLYLRDEEARQRIPATVEGFPLSARVTGPIEAF